MLVSIGRHRPPTDILDTILGCHARIRTHVGLAVRLAERSDVHEAQVAEAAGRVCRYFCEALPIHTLDEDQSLLPLLLGRSSNLDRVLMSMQEQHRAHELRLDRLVAMGATVRKEPARLDGLRDEFAEVANALSRELDEHLTLEERVVFPAARNLLGPTEKTLLAEEVRRRHRESDRKVRAAS